MLKLKDLLKSFDDSTKVELRNANGMKGSNNTIIEKYAKVILTEKSVEVLPEHEVVKCYVKNDKVIIYIIY